MPLFLESLTVRFAFKNQVDSEVKIKIFFFMNKHIGKSGYYLLYEVTQK